MAIRHLFLVCLLMPVAVVAEDWQAYTYPEPGFAIRFPGNPTVQTSRIRTAAGVTLKMTRYALRQDGILYTVSVVNYSSTNVDSLTTITETARSLGASGHVTAAGAVRLDGILGREMTVDGSDGSRSAIAIFFVDNHLYTLIGQALPPTASEKSGDAIRFRESLQFLGDAGSFGRFFHGAEGDHSGQAAPAPAADRAAPATRQPAATHPPANDPCVGKSAGATVQLETPGGPVPAICTLVARPL